MQKTIFPKKLRALLTKEEIALLRKLNTPKKIQDFLDALPFNFEEKEETHSSVRTALRRGSAHCFEGALIAALALWFSGKKPFLLDLQVIRPDIDHVVVPFQIGKHWGAFSKTAHNVLQYRDPIYLSIRELVASYFHEYFLENGKKTLRAYSEPFDLSKLSYEWVIGEGDQDLVIHALEDSTHHQFVMPLMIKNLRKAHPLERDACEYSGRNNPKKP